MPTWILVPTIFSWCIWENPSLALNRWEDLTQQRKAFSHRALFLCVGPPKREREERPMGPGARMGTVASFSFGKQRLLWVLKKKKKKAHIQAGEWLQHPTSLLWARKNTTPWKDCFCNYNWINNQLKCLPWPYPTSLPLLKLSQLRAMGQGVDFL